MAGKDVNDWPEQNHTLNVSFAEVDIQGDALIATVTMVMTFFLIQEKPVGMKTRPNYS